MNNTSANPGLNKTPAREGTTKPSPDRGFYLKPTVPKLLFACFRNNDVLSKNSPK
jgi:hypothetical protein